ncbi:MAG: hypothetical protein ACLRZT_16160 [Clostridium paraputrificum]|uniref:hypothetical protein n=1 Tax=Clostridium sp. TaxID=1506 RepID=UPI002901F088|nr:hypothetical protein [Clostridium sp.]MDU1311716.1 hypothetical protein [Clostridium sp.]MDU1408867.1 hypothetical protein [Clostridium sp.]MDU2994777.1 hypothetical protein [Clostridium sp.]
MYFIEILLGLSVFTFIFSFIPVIFLKNNKINNIMATVEVVSIILIVICLFLYICNALMTCITIWFGNW